MDSHFHGDKSAQRAPCAWRGGGWKARWGCLGPLHPGKPDRRPCFSSSKLSPQGFWTPLWREGTAGEPGLSEPGGITRSPRSCAGHTGLASGPVPLLGLLAGCGGAGGAASRAGRGAWEQPWAGRSVRESAGPAPPTPPTPPELSICSADLPQGPSRLGLTIVSLALSDEPNSGSTWSSSSS